MKVFLVAGEASGDRLGATLMAGLKRLMPGVRFEGIGGPEMISEGLTSRFAMDELSVMGLVEILPRYTHLKRRIAETAAAVVASEPDVLVTIDSPDFGLRVARQVKAASDVRCVHYVAPTVWAWRPKRARKMARYIDQVLALFPFEPPYMEAVGLRCDFVGHPVASETLATPVDGLRFRQRHEITGPLVLALPGSRRGEVARLADRFGETLRLVLSQRPGARVVVPCAAPVADLVAEKARRWPGAPILIDPRTDPDAWADKRAAFRAADVALAASGTVSLELAAAETPMVIAYDMNRLTLALMRRMMLVDTVTLVNLVSDTRTVPEFIGADFRPGPVAEALLRQLADPAAQRAAMAVTMERLGQYGEDPGMRAARAVLDGLGRRPTR
ncbi:lipid-A-disaccharide synthase [Oceanicola granulosus HTCC2516]|uniref:Lipid-A-disaccharide synthase n=1 Tax=Oceanicola granulosus (strain ATCC BAA-861 / DSM 15982 / KCTC 12143 / HTCC2516) TaxID=314256 RepID=Q2CHX0_OCEGH|nr:lipid-A-disaccharide synthase [Oceanicola granulosus]EAR52174.1 lipid-A-disaccharide synthase [Oceanicola granulosus HTCC2516]